MTDPIRMVAIDPGEVNTGVSLWLGADCYDTFKADREEIYGWLFHQLRDECVDEVVCEDFRLYPDKSKEQAYGQIVTVKRIGVIEYLCGLAGVPCVLQGASIKKPTFAIMKGRGIEIKGGNQHERDATAHGYYRLTHRA